MATNKKLIHLFGPFKITDENGLDITPTSARLCAVLAILATSKNYERSRRWLESTLWSNREQIQASASLRQLLVAIRKSFPADLEPIKANRQTVSLNEQVFSVAPRSEKSEDNSLGFLEGMNIRDEAFQSWRSQMIASFEGSSSLPQRSDQPAKLKRLVVSCKGISTGLEAEPDIAQFPANRLGQHIMEVIGAECLVATGTESDEIQLRHHVDVNLNCCITNNKGRHTLFLDISSAQTDQLIFTGSARLEDGVEFQNSNLAFERLGFEAAEAVTQNASKILGTNDPRQKAYEYQAKALQHIFRFDESSLNTADHYLDLAYSLNDNPLFLAWKAMIRCIQAIELFEEDMALLKTQAQTLINQCLFEGSDNPLILSLVSLVQIMLFDDEEFAIDLAVPALRKNPSSAFALQAMAASQIVCGDTDSGYLYSAQSRKTADGSSFKHWWDLYHSLACIANGKYGEALKMAEIASKRSPQFRPPLRQLISLYTYFGETEKAREAALRLASLEPNFAIQKFLSEPDYPNRTLRNAGLLQLDYNHLKDIPQAPNSAH